MSGLSAARALAHVFDSVCLFDKARGPGGRMSSRRADEYSFDMGAQYFTARDPRFREQVGDWQRAGVVARWDGRIATAEGGRVTTSPDETERFVGTPRMSAVTRYLADGLDIRYQTRISAITPVGGAGSQLRLSAEEPSGQAEGSGSDLGLFDAVIVTTPPVQAAPLIARSALLAEAAAAVRMAPCWAVLAAFAQPLDIAADGLFVRNSALSWAARDSSKPGRSAVESWVLHGSPQWSRQHLEAPREQVIGELLAALASATGATVAAPHFVQAHRWRYSIAEEPLQRGAAWDSQLRLGLCGDW
ncbi:MAG: FAD-dependent oxidoreductase, partial [Myxococcota bacterium]